MGALLPHPPKWAFSFFQSWQPLLLPKTRRGRPGLMLIPGLARRVANHARVMVLRRRSKRQTSLLCHSFVYAVAPAASIAPYVSNKRAASTTVEITPMGWFHLAQQRHWKLLDNPEAAAELNRVTTRRRNKRC